jgi:hypothetical protein
MTDRNIIVSAVGGISPKTPHLTAELGEALQPTREIPIV